MTEWKKVGARSRSRGYRFEKDVAEALGWSRVPFSGRNIAFGEGDVIDGFINGDGLWIAECKMRTIRNNGLRIEGEWIRQAGEAGERSGRFPLIVVGAKAAVNKKPFPHVFLNSRSSQILEDYTKQKVDSILVVSSKSSIGAFTVKIDQIQERTKIRIETKTNNEFDEWETMLLWEFVEQIEKHGAFVPGPFTYSLRRG